MWYRHDFGLLEGEERERRRLTAREWLRAWPKVRDFETPPSTPSGSDTE